MKGEPSHTHQEDRAFLNHGFGNPKDVSFRWHLIENCHKEKKSESVSHSVMFDSLPSHGL